MTFAFFFISMVMPFYLWASIRRAIMEEEPEMDLSSSQYNKHRHRKKVTFARSKFFCSVLSFAVAWSFLFVFGVIVFPTDDLR